MNLSVNSCMDENQNNDPNIQLNDLQLKTEVQEFIGWQCRIRQYAVRKQEGRPSAAMRPNLYINGDLLGPITVNLIKEDPAEVTSEFQFIHRKTQDPKARYENGLKILCEYYYQRTNEFDHEITAIFALDSELAEKIVKSDDVELRFEQSSQSYSLKCNARIIPIGDEKYEASYWHNALFNPNMPGKVNVIGFKTYELINA